MTQRLPEEQDQMHSGDEDVEENHDVTAEAGTGADNPEGETEPLPMVEQWDSMAPGDETIADQVAEGDAAGADEGEGQPTGDSQAEEPFELVQQLEYVPPSGKVGKQQEEEGPELQFHSVSEARAVLEGYLFTSNEPLTVQRLSKLMNNLHPRSVRGLVLELQMEYDERGGALQIVEIAGGFQMATRPHLSDWMFRMHRHKRRSALSPATLETLAIVAYKQPITKGEIETIRGVESSGTMRTLQDLNLVEASGRREVVGRPQLFVTTDQFLKAFGLRSLADLPSIAELRALFADDQKLRAAIAKKPAGSEEAAEGAEGSAEGGEGQPESRGEGDGEREAGAAGEDTIEVELTDEFIAETDELQELAQADEDDEDLEAEDAEEFEEGEDEGFEYEGGDADGEDDEDDEEENDEASK